MGKSKTYWNYRVVATRDGTEAYFTIRDVYYKRDKPYLMGQVPSYPGGETLKILKKDIKRFKEACEKPILWGEEGADFLTPYEEQKTKEEKGV